MADADEHPEREPTPDGAGGDVGDDAPARDVPAGEGPDEPSAGDEGDGGSSDADGDATDRSSAGGPRGRDVAVPLRVYKTVTVFSTLIAVAAVVLGFVLLDRATRRATAAPEDVNVLLAVAGLGSIGAGAVVYAFSTRFRVEGMGKG